MTIVDQISSSTGLEVLKAAVKAKPLLSINFFPHGIVMQHNTPTGETEKIVSPADVARLLHNQPFSWGSGLLTPDTLFVGDSAGYRVVVEFRKPQMTGIWLDGSDEPVRVPMPAPIMVRWLTQGQPIDYNVFAAKHRPAKLSEKLYAAPLPNTYNGGGICWGNISKRKPGKHESVSLAKDWKLLLGTRFGDHSVHSKSKKHNDIRRMLLELDSNKAKKYPMDDLIETGYTLEMVISSKEKKQR